MNPLGNRRQADELALALDGGRTPSDPSVAALVPVAERLRDTVADPAPEFRLQLRERLMTAAETELVPAAPAPGPRRPTRSRPPAKAPLQVRLRRRLGVVAGAAVVAGAGVSVVAVSAQSLPGDVLYPVKRASEDVELLVRTDPVAEGRIQLEHAATRLDEVDALARSSDAGSTQNTVLVSSTLEDFSTQARDGAAELLTAYEEDADPAAIDQVNGFTADATRRLQGLVRTVPADSGDELAAATETLVDLTEQTRGACRSCPAADPRPLTELSDSVQLLLAEIDERAMLGGSAPGLDGDLPTVESPRDDPTQSPDDQPVDQPQDRPRGDDPDRPTEGPRTPKQDPPRDDPPLLQPPGNDDPHDDEAPPDDGDPQLPRTPDLPTRDLPDILRDLLGGQDSDSDRDPGQGTGDDTGSDSGGSSDDTGDDSSDDGDDPLGDLLDGLIP